MTSDALAWLRWVLVPNLGLRRCHRLLSLVDSPQALFSQPDRWPLPDSVKSTLRQMNRLGEQHPVHRQALQQLHWADNSPDHHLICLDSDAYPEPLAQLDEGPLVLWARGQRRHLTATAISMVGSRHASANALRHAKRFSSELGSTGLVIVSGGAQGVDSACHQAALAAGGATIAVLGNGVDVVYPKANAKLFADIAHNGLLLSEYPLQTQPRPGHFPRRNRLISALGQLLIVVEAGLKSGSLITAQHALEQGKDIFAIPGDIANPNTEGCHQLIKDGAYLLSTSEDIFQNLEWHHRVTETPLQPEMTGLSGLQQQIYQLLQIEQQPLDALIYALKVPAEQLLEPLLEMELSGLIDQQPGGYALC